MSGRGVVYRGYRQMQQDIDGKPICVVTWTSAKTNRTLFLPKRLEMVNHSPTGFEWGYAGSGPAQLAFALAYHATRSKQRALRVYQALKFASVTMLPHDGWTLTWEQLIESIRALEERDDCIMDEEPPPAAGDDVPSVVRRSCSWCHEMNGIEPGAFCHRCGHRADLPRSDCNCASCQRGVT